MNKVACAREDLKEVKAIESSNLDILPPNMVSQSLKIHLLAPAIANTDRSTSGQDAPVYESYNELLTVASYALQISYICRCKGVQPIPPATTTVTGVATHYLTTSTVSSSSSLLYKTLLFMVATTEW